MVVARAQEGALVADDQSEVAYMQTVAGVKARGPEPVGFLINPLEDRLGGRTLSRAGALS